VDRQRVASGAALEDRFGYSRAERALGELGATLRDVVRTRIYITDAADMEEVGRAHAEAFGGSRPATTGLVTELLDPRWHVEIEAEAVVAVSARS